MAEYNPSKIIKDGNTYNFRDNTKIPLTGTNALAGSIVPTSSGSCSLGSTTKKFIITYSSDIVTDTIKQDKDNSGIQIWSSASSSNGARLELYAKNSSYKPGCAYLIAEDSTNTSYKLKCDPSGTLLWTGSPITYSSDRRLKDEIESIPDEILDAWENLEPKQYKLKSDLENDKETAQIHYGWIAQDVESIIKGGRKTEVKSGLWLHETWEEQEEVSHEETYTEESQTKDGTTETVTKTRKVIDQPYKAKGDSYGLRYTECLVVECKYLRRCISRLTARERK